MAVAEGLGDVEAAGVTEGFRAAVGEGKGEGLGLRLGNEGGVENIDGEGEAVSIVGDK